MPLTYNYLLHLEILQTCIKTPPTAAIETNDNTPNDDDGYAIPTATQIQQVNLSDGLIGKNRKQLSNVPFAKTLAMVSTSRKTGISKRRLSRRQLIQRLRDIVEGSMLQLDSTTTWDQLS